ncbi:c-type cytochrome biogenesis protein CcmI [Azonexus sp.]|jgi:cytochrome c-type biogenesis protein CcmH|uniref:c-type cytochrome biogenesis protein CcmI n=1 Tax=Azonexus sp. TaxID=1872668 RepID=UPI00283853FC|nr:c-type cytochrome biogenesis protein CcmI [Azonexus sp.]MDR1994495.1 c-type cytochrome biogenesis protein CcmI [Azonexus sp.]
MMPFILYATLIVVVICAFLFLPLWFGRRGAAAGGDRQTANLAIFRDQLADLERECQEGTLAAADFDQARQELQRRLLEETAPAAEPSIAPSVAGPSRKTAIALALLLPLGALLGYALLGNPAALDPARTAPAPAQANMSPEQIDEMVARLAERMQSNPDDMQGWLMLARSYKALGRYDDAVKAYAKAEKVIDDQPDLLASYAETIAMASGQGLVGKPRELVERALKIDPKHAHSLFLAGAAAIQANDTKQAIAYWEALLPLVEPGTELDQMLRAGIDKLKQGK